MNRLAVLLLTAGLTWAGSSARAADPIPAPTVPTIPAPIHNGNVLAPATAPNAGVAIPPRGTHGMVQPKPFNSSAYRAEPFDPVAKPPAPVAAPQVQAAPSAIAAAPAASCDACSSKSCWAKVKSWFCFRQTPVKLGLTPVPYTAPLAAQFPCTTGPGYSSSGCAKDAKCAPAPCGPRVGGGFPCRGTTAGCTPVAADPVMPGYRFAAPVNPNVAAPLPAAHHAPLPAVPYVTK